jgi:hypothetical protein
LARDGLSTIASCHAAERPQPQPECSRRSSTFRRGSIWAERRCRSSAGVCSWPSWARPAGLATTAGWAACARPPRRGGLLARPAIRDHRRGCSPGSCHCSTTGRACRSAATDSCFFWPRPRPPGPRSCAVARSASMPTRSLPLGMEVFLWGLVDTAFLRGRIPRAILPARPQPPGVAARGDT